MSNLFRIFKALVPDPPLLVATVTQVIAPEVVQVTLPDGGISIVRGTAILGAHVFVRDGVIEGAAPSLPIVIIEV